MTSTAIRSEVDTFRVSLRLLGGHAFRVDFDDTYAPLQTDEHPPLGRGSGPAPSRLLAAAVANCLASSLLFCLRKSRVEVRHMSATVETTMTRNDDGRLRIERLDVKLAPDLKPEDVDRLGRCKELFEDYCIVTESVRAGIDVRATVEA